MQIAFARLVGDAAAREHFTKTPVNERGALAELPESALDGYARGLLEKRFHDVARSLPGSARASDFRDRFLRYAARRPIGGVDRHRHDAIAFARTLGTPLANVERCDLEALGGERIARIAFADGRVHLWLRVTRGGRLFRVGARVVRPGDVRAACQSM